MSSTIRLSTLAVPVLVMGALVCHGSAFANGRTGKLKNYQGILAVSGGACRVNVTLDPDLYVLTSLKDKYRVIRLRIVNDSATTLKLASAEDRVEVEFEDGTRVAAVLNLGRADPALWDALPAELRGHLAYPKVVGGRGEEQSVFLFMPIDSSPSTVPLFFRYRVASLGGRSILVTSLEPRTAE